jgi:hypothetical protein
MQSDLDKSFVSNTSQGFPRFFLAISPKKSILTDASLSAAITASFYLRENQHKSNYLNVNMLASLKENVNDLR